MSGFRVLDAAAPDDRAAWLAAWAAWPGREVSAHPDYVALFARPCDRVLCATMTLADGGVIYPLIARPLSAEPWAAADESAVDLTTPYGYGGPFTWGSGAAHAETFWDAFGAWASSAHVVSSFARLSLFPEQLLPDRGDVAVRQNNVVRTLDLASDAMWKDYAHKVRKNVNRARQSGLVVEVDEDGRRLDGFVDVYLSTMQRRQALSTYHFSRAFFQTIVEKLRGSFAFFHVMAGDRLVSTELVLVSADHLYSFLGGTVEDAFDLRPNDLLKHEVIEWGRAKGKRAFVLGGGYQGDDGIYKYKMSFAPNGSVPFRVATRCFDPAATARLVAARHEHATAHGQPWEPSPSFFPPYRG